MTHGLIRNVIPLGAWMLGASGSCGGVVRLVVPIMIHIAYSALPKPDGRLSFSEGRPSCILPISLATVARCVMILCISYAIT